MKSLQRIAGEEIGKLKLDARQGRALRRWLGEDAATLLMPEQEEFASVLKESDRLSKVYAMRSDLVALWMRSTASHEQLLKQLQEWIHRAEQSGIAQLEEFSLRLRRYAV